MKKKKKWITLFYYLHTFFVALYTHRITGRRPDSFGHFIPPYKGIFRRQVYRV